MNTYLVLLRKKEKSGKKKKAKAPGASLEPPLDPAVLREAAEPVHVTLLDVGHTFGTFEGFVLCGSEDHQAMARFADTLTQYDCDVLVATNHIRFVEGLPVNEFAGPPTRADSAKA